MLSIRFIGSLSRRLEYVSFVLCSAYWFLYSIARIRGIPAFISGIKVESIFLGIFLISIVGFNAIFFSRLLVELFCGVNSIRANVTRALFKPRLVIFLTVVLITFSTGGRFDYASYKLQWDLIGMGGNPWGSIEGGMVNAYGYIFNFLSSLHAINSLLPKFLFIFLLLVFAQRLASLLSDRDKPVALFLCINPYTVSTLAVYGFIDGMCSILLGLSLLELAKKDRKSSLRSGALLSLSFLTKFYTIALFPILFKSLFRSRLSKYFALGFLLSSSLIVLVSYIMWGNSILAPLLFAHGRAPSFLTIWKYIPYQELRTIVFSIFSFAAIAIASFKTRLSCSLRCAAVLSIVFGSYYLGHQQFYLGILVPLCVYITEVLADPVTRLKESELWSVAIMFGWLIFIQTGFELFDEFKPIGFHDLIPSLSFLNSLLLTSCGAFWLLKNASINKDYELHRALDL